MPLPAASCRVSKLIVLLHLTPTLSPRERECGVGWRGCGGPKTPLPMERKCGVTLQQAAGNNMFPISHWVISQRLRVRSQEIRLLVDK